jgi:2-keto-4-pentenoate hydratase
MLDLKTMHEQLLGAWDHREDAPAHLVGKLRGANIYRLQLKTLEVRLKAGGNLAGWKLGQTNRELRRSRGEDQPAPGFLLGALGLESGSELKLEEPGSWFVEPELALIMGRDVSGPDVTADTILGAVSGCACAFEIVRRYVGWTDLGTQRAVNGSTAGHVLGPVQANCPEHAALDDLVVTTHGDNQVFGPTRGGDVTDNPLDSTAWLANFLSAHGMGLKAGDVILTGTYSGLLPVAPGQHWRAEIEGLGHVELRTC